MTAKDRVEELLAAYGADPRRWPAAERHLATQQAPGRSAAAAVDDVLARATQPEVPEGARQRLAERLSAATGPVRVYRRDESREGGSWSLSWLAGLPLAASLALGIYLGAGGTLDSILPSAITGATVTADSGDDPGDFSGISDAETDAAGSLS